jgi:hypothetical protein
VLPTALPPIPTTALAHDTEVQANPAVQGVLADSQHQEAISNTGGLPWTAMCLQEHLHGKLCVQHECMT